MDQKLAELIEYHCNDYGGVSMRDDYSGRGMYGMETYAIVCEESPAEILGQLLARVRDEDIDLDELQEVKSFSMRTDSMGLGVVIY
jgi:hypothetical protein